MRVLWNARRYVVLRTTSTKSLTQYHSVASWLAALAKVGNPSHTMRDTTARPAEAGCDLSASAAAKRYLVHPSSVAQWCKGPSLMLFFQGLTGCLPLLLPSSCPSHDGHDVRRRPCYNPILLPNSDSSGNFRLAQLHYATPGNQPAHRP